MAQRKFQYIPRNSRSLPKNKASKYTSRILKSELSLANNDLFLDYQEILNGGCTYLPNFFTKTKDLTIFNKLRAELFSANTEVINWSKHQKHENPTFSPTFQEIVTTMATHFGMQVLQTRLNYYRNGNDWKPWHHDSHAYTDGVRENYTVGVSFGASRTLQFLHEASKLTFSFPQNNGDVFAFNAAINKKFMHGIPKDSSNTGERFSIIIWGHRY